MHERTTGTWRMDENGSYVANVLVVSSPMSITFIPNRERSLHFIAIAREKVPSSETYLHHDRDAFGVCLFSKLQSLDQHRSQILKL